MTVWLVGAGGRTPFVGHLRGAREVGRARLAWACRIAGSASVVEGWEAAEAARDALAGLRSSGDAEEVLAAACAALGAIDARWLGRGDLTGLLVATEGGAARAVATGLGAIWGADGASWRPVVPAGHALLGEPGVPDGRSHPLPLHEVWVGVPAGLPFPARDVRAACGVRS